MNPATAQARKPLPDFVALYRDGEGERHAVKVAILYPGGREHIWRELTAIESDTFIGRLANRPVHVSELSKGDARADQAMVTDWNYISGDKMHGSYTTRVALKKRPREQVRQLGLAPLP